jgi:hypothetical protein
MLLSSPVFRKQFSYWISALLTTLLLFTFTANYLFAQQTAAPQPVAPPSQASPAPASPGQSGAAQPAPSENMHPVQQEPIPGLDPKTMRPLYETIQEDWSNLQIGVSKLEPMPQIVGEVVEQDRFTRVGVRVQWRPGDPIDLTILLPKGVKNPPAVLYLYGPGTNNSSRFRDPRWAERVTSGGVAAVGFEMALTGARFRNRPMKQTMLTEFQEALGSTVHDVKFILDYMDKSGQFDMNHVGMFGDAVGGTVAILAAAADPRIKAVDTLEPWGDWPEFLAKSPVIADDQRANFLTPEFLKKVAPLDPVKWLPELKIPIRIQQIKETVLMPMECKEAIKAAAPKQAEVLRFAAVADITKHESGGRLFQWTKDKLQPQTHPAITNAKVAEAEQATKDGKSPAKN